MSSTDGPGPSPGGDHIGLFGGSNSIFNNPGQLTGGSTSVLNEGSANSLWGDVNVDSAIGGPFLYNGAASYLNSLFHPTGPATTAAPAPPNASAIAGASLSEQLTQEQSQYNASTMLNGGGGLPMSQSPITASNVLRAGTR